MNKSKIQHLQPLLWAGILSGIVVFAATFSVPSEAKNYRIGSFTPARLALGGIILMICAALAVLLIYERKDRRLSHIAESFLKVGDRPYFAFLILQGLSFGCVWGIWFSWLFVPSRLRPVLIWGAFVCFLAALLLRKDFDAAFQTGNYREKYRLFPKWSDLKKDQRKTLIPLLLLSLIYIAVLMPSNLNGSRDWDDFKHYGGDEYVMYPILRAVCDPGESFSQGLYHHYIYEDYHYGYPFYAWSSFVLAPAHWIYGSETMEHIEITLPTLRIFVSVIPLMAACLVLTFLFTRFRNGWLASLVYIFLLTAPGSLQNNQGFWHPDGLNLFFVCCALYFLQRDKLRFGRNFYLTAFFAGLSAATRLYGFFFFLAVGASLLSGLLRKTLGFRSFLVKAALFLAVMGGTILWSDPFLFREDARTNMLNIMKEKTGEMSSGYNGDFNDPKNDYRPGWDAWYPAFEDHYTEMFCFFFLLAVLLLGCWRGPYQRTARVTLLWWLVIAVYLIWFVAVKSTQYVLPMMLPLMSCVWLLPQICGGNSRKEIRVGAWLLTGGIYTAQLVINLIKIAPRFR